MQRTIAVFGSSAPLPGSADYEVARAMGRGLAEAGLAVATGGYSGTMAAVSQGASEAGGHVIGVTADRIEQFRVDGPNEWVAYEVRYPTLRERLNHLVEQNDGMVVLPGGIGTLSELALAWSLLQVAEIEPRPLVLLGQFWRARIEAFLHPDYVREGHAQLIEFADTAPMAVSIIQRYLNG